MIMNTLRRTLTLWLSLALPAVGHAQTGAAEPSAEVKRLQQATEVVQQLTRIPEQAIPPTLLDQAYGVAVIPNVIKVGFWIGGRRGKGVLVVRRANGEWSNPAFITLTGGSIGWQIGGQSTDIILVFKSARSVEGITDGKFTLGADAAVAAGPVGRQAAAATDASFQAEVYSYSRSRGLFAGIALEGAALQIDETANRSFYSNQGITSTEILADQSLRTPAAAREFILTLEGAAPALPADAPTPGLGGEAEAMPAPEQAGDEEDEARTFALEEPAGNGN
jgi:lipid-binding SYLF domain-containing protein